MSLCQTQFFLVSPVVGSLPGNYVCPWIASTESRFNISETMYW